MRFKIYSYNPEAAGGEKAFYWPPRRTATTILVAASKVCQSENPIDFLTISKAKNEGILEFLLRILLHILV
jgi:hypothetical protein